MQGPNPFSLWAQDPAELAGRKPEINMFRSILKDIAARGKITLLVNGGPGMGKSLFLSRLAQIGQKEGFFCPLIVAGRESHGSIMAKIRSQTKTYMQERCAAGAISERAVSNISFGDDFLLETAGASKRHGEGLIMLIDDFDRLREPDRMLSWIQKTDREAKNSGICWVLSGMRQLHGIDIEIGLLPFDEHDLHEMVDKALKKGPPKMAEGCISTILEESEGNPQVARTACYVIYENLGEKEKIISRKHYISSKPAIMSMLSRELFDRLYEHLPESEKKVLLAFAKAGGRGHISDIAQTLGMRHATTLALRLMERGQLIRIERGDYRIFTRLYGKYVMGRS